MDKILAINTIKNVFSALGAKTSDSNYAVALLDKTSAEPKGMMDFANLASVLGANELIVDNTYDANNMLNRGVVYRWSSSVPSNAPLSYAAMIVYKIGPTNYAQFCISRTWGDRHAMFKRVLKDNNEWSPWQRIYDEGILNDSAILSPLASALGGANIIYLTSTKNLDDCVDLGVFYVWGESAPANSPEENLYSMAFNIPSAQGPGYRFQFCIKRGNGTSIYYRYMEGGSWERWRKIVPTTI